MLGDKAAAERTFWSDARLIRLSLALGIALILAFLICYSFDKDGSSALKRGDFPGLYSPSVILASGQADRLYDIQLHQQIQNAAWPEKNGAMYISVYPPFFGVLLEPLAKLSAYQAKNVWTVICLVCFLICFVLLCRVNSEVSKLWPFYLVCSLAFIPVLLGVIGGQNTAISMLLYVAGALLLERRDNASNFFAGMLFGLWLFKPQFGLLAALYLLFLRRRAASLAGFALIGLIYWCMAAHVLGPNWLSIWGAATSRFAEINFGLNSYQMSSFAGFFACASAYGFLPAIYILPFALIASMIAVIIVLKRYGLSIWLLGPLMVLISPQTLFYDLGISFVSILRFIKLKNDRNVSLLLLFVLIAGLSYALRRYIPALPFYLAIIMLIWTAGLQRDSEKV